MQVPGERRYKILRICLILSIITLAPVIAYAATIASYHQNGHIRIVNGTNAGVSINPTFLEFGNVTLGSVVTKPITVLNTGDCTENVTATGSQAGQPTVLAFIPSLAPSHSLIVNATYDTKLFTPGDYTFAIDWKATCL